MINEASVGDVKIFTLNTLLEIIAKVDAIDGEYFTLSQALLLRLEPQEGPDGRPAIGAALGPLSMFIDKDEKSQGANMHLYKSSILGISDPPEGILGHYSQLTGSIMAPPSKKIQMPA